jgi:hypothetical protein
MRFGQQKQQQWHLCQCRDTVAGQGKQDHEILKLEIFGK